MDRIVPPPHEIAKADYEEEAPDMGDSSGSGQKPQTKKKPEKRAELEAKIVHAVEEKEPLKVIEKAVFDLNKWLYDTDPAFTREKDKLEEQAPKGQNIEEDIIKDISKARMPQHVIDKEIQDYKNMNKLEKYDIDWLKAT